MSAKPPIVPFVPPVQRPAADVTGAAAPVTETERTVIRMLARRAARTVLAAATSIGRSKE